MRLRMNERWKTKRKKIKFRKLNSKGHVLVYLGNKYDQWMKVTNFKAFKKRRERINLLNLNAALLSYKWYNESKEQNINRILRTTLYFELKFQRISINRFFSFKSWTEKRRIVIRKMSSTLINKQSLFFKVKNI